MQAQSYLYTLCPISSTLSYTNYRHGHKGKRESITTTTIIINVFVYRHKVVTSEALGPGRVIPRKGMRESPGEEECL